MLKVSSLSNPSWRVWGEIKRHRTLEQSVESVYSAIDRSHEKLSSYREKIISGNLDDETIKQLDSVFMIPLTFLKNENKSLLNSYLQLFLNSLDAYKELVSRGIPEADAASLVPRGIRLTVYKVFDLYNILEGYIPLRCCDTAESEMMHTTDLEVATLKKILPEYLTKNIGPKCASIGYCLEPKMCDRIKKFVGFDYTEEAHKFLSS